ncbi:MAG: hypothetical protein KAR19_04920 [Bacteroidales bacterium]|nr:hypothetical protein [Bacteroidales bacterium]
MMIQLSIPDIFVGGFKSLVSADEKLLDQLEEAIISYEDLSKPDLLATHFNTLELLAKDVSHSISTSIIGFFGLIESGIEENEADLIESLIYTLQNLLIEEEIEVSEDKWQLLKSFFLRISKESQLRMRSKAAILSTEYNKILRSTRIISDIRPIFTIDNLDAECSFIVHQLKIDWYGKGDSFNSEYFALDLKDLLELRNHIDRALSKEEKIKEKIGGIMKIIDIT